MAATLVALLGITAGASSASAQAVIALPNTISTVAGGANSGGTGVTTGVLPAKGAACSAGSPYTSTDAFGDGCPGINTAISADFRGGLQVDGQGNVYILDSTNSLLRKIDAKSGLVTAVTGTAITGCTTNSDSYGDSCPIAMTKLNAPRGVNIDPYGNVLIAGYNMNTINIICNTISPLCPNTANRKQVGYMYRIAGCVGSATATGTTATGTTTGTGGDGYAASPYGNLAGDVADWNPTNATNLGSTAYGSCTAAATLGAVYAPRGVAGDKYGNVFIAETGSSTGLRYRVVVGPPSFTLPNGTQLTNPMASIIALSSTYASLTASSAYGKVYTIMGGSTTAAPASIGAACAGPAGGTTLDINGDGCPYYQTVSGSGVQGVGTDIDGNVIFADQTKSIVRVLYVGGTTMAAAIRAANNNPSLAVTVGSVYPIIGAVNSGATNATLSATPTLGTQTSLGNGTSKVAIDPAGNIYISDFNTTSVLFFDIKTGYVRKLIGVGTVCAAARNSIGDGCPANTSSFGAGSGMGIGLNPQGDLFLADQTNQLVRKITASNLIATPLGTALTQTEILHAPAGTASVTAALASPSPDINVGSPTCATNPDGTTDCTVPVSFTPLTPGLRGAVMTATPQGGGSTALLPVTGIATGSALVVDSTSPTSATLASVSGPVSLTVDGSGNVSTMSTSSGKVVQIINGTASTITSSALPASPFQITVDPNGIFYLSGTGTSSITKVAPIGGGAYSTSTFTYNPGTTASPAGIVADRLGNLFVADQTAKAVYEIPVGSNFESLNTLQPIIGGFQSVGELAIDGSGDLLIADPTAHTVSKLLAGATAVTVVASGVTPTHIAADTAGDVFVADSSQGNITQYPLSGPSSLVLLGGSVTGLTVDGAGVVYYSATAASSVFALQRQNASYNFGTSTTATFSGTLTNAGNLLASGVGQTDTGDFALVGGTSSPCNVASTQAIGTSCTISATFTPQTGSGQVTDAVTLTVAGTSTGKLSLIGTKNGSAVTTTTTIGNKTPANPVYVASGTEVTFTVNVAASAGTPSGSVAVTVDTNTPVTYTLTNGAATVALSGLTAGTHMISAAYATQNGFTGSSTASATTFTIAQAQTTVSWTPATTTQQYSAAIGTGVLNATASSGGVPVAGNFVYTATLSGGSAAPVHSASFPAIGTYALAVTFIPNDAVDFSSATGSVASYTVTKATTTAAVGATQMLVAADGTGNFTNVQTAINAIPATGGSVYIKPGTYVGDVTVVQPNVSMRGLGGDPTAVVLTHAGGAFGGSGVYAYAGEFTVAQNNGSQLPAGSTVFNGDEGSATLVVAKGINAAVSPTVTYTPNNFYAENITLANTYDTDNVTTTTTYVSSGTCTANAGAAMTYLALYNAGTECASQALAIWTVSDLAVMNNVYTTSLQDTIYAGSQGAGSNGYVPSRQYWFRGKVVGDVDFIFGDAAAVFDYSSVYTAFHGTTATGTETIEAQNKMRQTGSTGDYLSGYIMNSNVFTSQAPGMTSLYYGRPYGPYSTWIMLNSYTDQVNAAGYIEFSGQTNLPTSTYAEYNNILYTDPATGAADLNGVLYNGSGGNSGSGVTGTREAVSQDPGTIENANSIKTTLTAAQAQQYFPTNFLSQTVPAVLSTTANWNPTAALAAGVNGFVPAGGSATVAGGSSVTILMRPQTPGLGAVNNGNYTIPTGTYTLTDNFNGSSKTLATGSLDAAGEAYFTTSGLFVGTHNMSWSYSGDANFGSSTTASAYVVTVTGTSSSTTISLTANPIIYGQSATVNATVTPASGTVSPTGSVTLTIDGTSTQTATLSGGATSFTVANLLAGTHSFSASYGGSTSFGASTTTSNTSLTVSKATLTDTATCANRVYGQVNSCTLTVTGYQYADTQAVVFTGTPAATGTATRASKAATYQAQPLASSLTFTTAGTNNYLLSPVLNNYTVSGGAAQSIVFAPLPNFPHGGSYQLTARATSGLPVTYTVTAGSASISGSTLTVTGAGTVTVQASQPTDPNGDYAAATPVSQTFTAP